ncbi:UNVERIFIED_CONTAM: 2-oxoisovalerate dehydrogenase subunit alpha 2, mitochondrial [Sesamum calycinum]|uniref:3-methyl-2-oxobutanoate dehydrogenase (2-methylpropanoyl-transferring) n=1 Tax=Sesamum calycinum TaxID=2727403 RepID=A0AAW2P7V8_9LAMI
MSFYRLARSRTITCFLKTKICPFETHERFITPNYSFFHAYSSYKTLAGNFIRRPQESWGQTANILAFRRFESARAGEQAEAVSYTDDDEDDNQERDAYNFNVQAIDFPGGRVTFTPQIKFISESTDKRVPCYRVLDDDGYPIAGSRFEQVDKETAVKMYKSMVTLQIMDHIFYEAQRQGRISFYMTSMGEEAINIATAAALSPDDIILPQYREPGILLWRGFTIEEFANQCFGTKNDTGKGRQMPVHYGSKKHNFVTVSSPIATQLPQAAGIAYSLKMDNKEACAVAFTGDGGTSEGDFHAGLNFAAVMEAPVLFICRNNGWAISTPISDQFRSDGVVVKGQAYGIRSVRIDGNDTLAVYTAIRTARDMVVREQKPILVEALTYRVGHHSTSDDSTKYRPMNEIEHWKTARNPLADSENGFRETVMNAIQVADKTEKSSLKELFTDVYDRLPSNLQDQEKSLRETIKRHGQDFPADVPL